ncbi:MAG: tRNA (guanosine(37)-N1)-methyltransferase TrmD [Coriobacteriia bacterium]|nr:tRNA (guanosine(37)-N1)-methyltransferase TrmD [Coriobacteriia bacterium]
MRIDVLTILPDMFSAPMSASVIGIAREKGLLEIHVHDLRDYTHDRHRTTDDAPYGGGPGMVMKPEPVFEAVESIQALDDRAARVVMLSPRGAPLVQSSAERFSRCERLLLVCGRYEGFDERIYDLADEIVSIGDYVLTGGELPAMVLIDATSRLLPGVLGHEKSTQDESFTTGLLEYPQYTRPPVFRGMSVPDVLRSGDHARIESWRRQQAIGVTARVRPDLLERACLDDTERATAREESEGSTAE